MPAVSFVAGSPRAHAKRLLPALALVVVPLVVCADASAAPGDLDPTFGSGGTLTTDLGGYEWAGAVLVQPDGKIVAGGISGDRFALARYDADGGLDATFGSGGSTVDAGV